MALMNSWAFSRLIAENERAGETLAQELDTVAESSSSYAFCLPGSRALAHFIFLQDLRLRIHGSRHLF